MISNHLIEATIWKWLEILGVPGRNIDEKNLQTPTPVVPRSGNSPQALLGLNRFSLTKDEEMMQPGKHREFVPGDSK